MAKRHWTQRPENKEKVRKLLSKAAKARHKKARSMKQKSERVEVVPPKPEIVERHLKGRGKNNGKISLRTENDTVAYLFGGIEKEVSLHARSTGIPFPVLANRLSSLLQRSASGTIQGPEV